MVRNNPGGGGGATPANIFNATYTFAVDAEANDSYAVTVTDGADALADGLKVTIKVATANTGASTLDYNALGAKAILKLNDQATITGDIEAGMMLDLRFDEDNDVWQWTGTPAGLVDTGILNVVEDTTPQLGGSLDANSKAVNLSKGVDVASGTALNLGADGNSFDVTGTTTITSINTEGIGTTVVLHFDGILTFTHHATDLVLPTGANITTAAGDIAVMYEYATGDWRCISYTRADGTALAAAAGGSSTALDPANFDADWFSYQQNWYCTDSVAYTFDATSLTSGSFVRGYTKLLFTTGSAVVKMMPIDGSSEYSSPGLGSYVEGLWFRGMLWVNANVNGRVGFGAADAQEQLAYAHTATNERACFLIDEANTKIYAVTADGSSVTATDVTGSYTVGAVYHTYTMHYTDGSNCLFYIDGTLVATHTTNLPAGGQADNFGFGYDGAASFIVVSPTQIATKRTNA